MVGVSSAEHENKEGKREEKRTRAKEKVMKELTERNVVRMLKMKIKTENETVKNQTEYLGRKVRMLEEMKKRNK